MNSRTVLLLSSSAQARLRLLEVLAQMPGAELVRISVVPEAQAETQAVKDHDSSLDASYSQHCPSPSGPGKGSGRGEYLPFNGNPGHFLQERRSGQAERRRAVARPLSYEACEEVRPEGGKYRVAANGRRVQRRPRAVNGKRAAGSTPRAGNAEHERQLACELHDDFGQLLAAMKIDISLMHQFVPPESAQLAHCLGSIDGLVDAMLVSVRRILAGLPPRILEERGLLDAIAELLHSYENRYKFTCRLHLPAAEPALCASMQTAIFRIVQEICNNIAKHAHATKVDASIDCACGVLLLRVADNGIGMSLTQMNKQGSFGIAGMHERVALLNGVMNIDSMPGRGTTVSVRIPLPVRPN